MDLCTATSITVPRSFLQEYTHQETADDDVALQKNTRTRIARNWPMLGQTQTPSNHERSQRRNASQTAQQMNTDNPGSNAHVSHKTAGWTSSILCSMWPRLSTLPLLRQPVAATSWQARATSDTAGRRGDAHDVNHREHEMKKKKTEKKKHHARQDSHIATTYRTERGSTCSLNQTLFPKAVIFPNGRNAS